MYTNNITLSVVSHGQSSLINLLFKSLNNIKFKGNILCTLNMGFELFDNYPDLNITFITNTKSLGFGNNHNNAFKFCKTKYFAVVNPDIIFIENPFNELINILENELEIGVISIASLNKNGELQDNARNFPTMTTVFKKFLNHKDYIKYELNSGLVFSDWISGQFMFIDSNKFKLINGFSNKYFMYYEDVDLCYRLKNIGLKSSIYTNCALIHDARRSSHVDIKLLLVHIKSMITFFLEYYSSKFKKY